MKELGGVDSVWFGVVILIVSVSVMAGRFHPIHFGAPRALLSLNTVDHAEYAWSGFHRTS